MRQVGGLWGDGHIYIYIYTTQADINLRCKISCLTQRRSAITTYTCTSPQHSYKLWNTLPSDRDTHKYIASYPGLLIPMFVTFSTNVGEGLVKLSHVQWRNDVPGHVEEWHIPGKTSATQTVKRLSAQHQTVFQHSLGSEAALQLYRSTVPLLHMSGYVTAHDSVLPGLPRISIASDKCWGGKA